MPRVPSIRATAPGRVAALAGAVTLAGVVALTGCGAPPELTQRRGFPVPSPSQSPTSSTPTASGHTPTAPPTPAAPSVPPAPTFGEFTAVDCAGRPSGDQVISFLRRTSRLLPAGVRVTVATGPLCAGDWQYTVLQIRDRELDPLQVVTNGAPGTLDLVTAGTNVCNAEVRATAPYGIRSLACDGGVGSGTGL